MTAHLSVLDTAAQATVSYRNIERRSDVTRFGLLIREPIGPVPAIREWRLVWSPALRAVMQRIVDHYAANYAGVFQVRMPGGAAVWVRYTAAPRVTQRTAGAWDVDVGVEEAFAIRQG